MSNEELLERMGAITCLNKGACTVVGSMWQCYQHEALELFEKLELKGPNVYLAFADFSNKDYETLYSNLKDPNFLQKLKEHPGFVV